MVREPSRPSITLLAVITLILVVIGGIYLAAYLPKVAPLAPAVLLLAGATLVLLANLVLLRRLHDFSWDSFFLVARWSLLAYVIIAGMLEYVFLVDGVRGSLLLVLSGMLLIYAVNIPLLLAYSVARYQPSGRVSAPAR